MLEISIWIEGLSQVAWGKATFSSGSDWGNAVLEEKGSGREVDVCTTELQNPRLQSKDHRVWMFFQAFQVILCTLKVKPILTGVL